MCVVVCVYVKVPFFILVFFGGGVVNPLAHVLNEEQQHSE